MDETIEVGDTVILPDGPEGVVVALVGNNGLDVKGRSHTGAGTSLFRALKKDCKLVHKRGKIQLGSVPEPEEEK